MTPGWHRLRFWTPLRQWARLLDSSYTVQLHPTLTQGLRLQMVLTTKTPQFPVWWHQSENQLTKFRSDASNRETDTPPPPLLPLLLPPLLRPPPPPPRPPFPLTPRPPSPPLSPPQLLRGVNLGRPPRRLS